jgi:hypothetical protein
MAHTAPPHRAQDAATALSSIGQGDYRVEMATLPRVLAAPGLLKHKDKVRRTIHAHPTKKE